MVKSSIQNPKITHSGAFTTLRLRSGFTIVELLVVIVVIGILAGITIVSYTGVTQKASTVTLQSDLSTAKTQIDLYKVLHGTYPTTLDVNNCPTAPVSDINYCLKPSQGNTFSDYTSDGTSFGLEATNTAGTVYFVTDATSPQIGGILPTSSPYIQTITSASCPATRTQVQDARDGHTYWIQKLADGKCWMLTNLGYAGGGTNTYGDVKTLTNGTGGLTTLTVASYYVTPSTINYTTEPAAPSTSTDGTGQYGYLYNWCGAMGGQATAACANTTTPEPITTVSVCPAGWRLPTGNSGEFVALNTTVNGGSTTTDAGLIAVPWLAQRGGMWNSGFDGQGSYGYYWSSNQSSSTNAYGLVFDSTSVDPSIPQREVGGFAVRCVAI